MPSMSHSLFFMHFLRKRGEIGKNKSKAEKGKWILDMNYSFTLRYLLFLMVLEMKNKNVSEEFNC